MLAKNVNDNACFLNKRGACEFFASKLAPTVLRLVPPTFPNRAPTAAAAWAPWPCTPPDNR
ncbi:hypothetical protein DXU77_26655 [Pseudomonas lactis]|nr:hypothetical protein [Pseudomonas lactis]